MTLFGLHPELRPAAEALLQLAQESGVRVYINSVRRSRAQQAKLYARYLRGQNPYPVAPPGTSLHELGLAFDISTYPDVLPQLGAIWRSWGGRWSPADRVHFSV